MSPAHDHAAPAFLRLLEEVRVLAEASDDFDEARLENQSLLVHAADAPSEVFYRIEMDSGTMFVSWISADRYVSQSIEAELMWTGDDLDDLIDEELIDTGWTHGRLGEMEHFRNDQQLFTFRSAIHTELDSLDPQSLYGCLLAYHLAFSELGDMKPDAED